MRSLYRPAWGATQQEKTLLRSQAADSVRVRGTGQTPDPPRDLQAQSGNAKVLLSWKPPGTPISGYRIYRDNEHTLVLAVQDAGTLLADVPAGTGATPPPTNFFISCVNAFGNESRKVQVISAAKVDATAPSDPAPPPDTSGGGGGGGTGDSDIELFRGAR